MIDQGQAMDIPRQIDTGDPYPLRGLVGFGVNYRMFPDSSGWLEAVQKLDFVCVADLFATDSSKYADIVLAGLRLGRAERGALLPAEVRHRHPAGHRAYR